MTCRNVELIPGGHICSGPYGCRHLHGRAFRWWRCGVCAAPR